MQKTTLLFVNLKMAKQSGTRLLYNAHAHLPDYKDQKLQLLNSAAQNSCDTGYTIINGTLPADWATVIEFTQKCSRALPAIGLHPQNVKEAPEDWKETFLQFLNDNPICSIGEIGLDRRHKNSDIEKQLGAFCWQLQQASERNRPVSIHCVKAIGMLMEILRTHDLPSRGIHLHAYNGPVELIPELVGLGAYFSFAARQLEFDSEKFHNRICAVPIRRLLIETDVNYSNDCSTLYCCYRTVAKIRKVSLEELAECVAENFKTYFLTS